MLSYDSEIYECTCVNTETLLTGGGVLEEVKEALPLQVTSPQLGVQNSKTCTCTNRLWILFDDKESGFIHYQNHAGKHLFKMYDIIDILAEERINVKETIKNIKQHMKPTGHYYKLLQGHANRKFKCTYITDAGVQSTLFLLTKSPDFSHKAPSFARNAKHYVTISTSGITSQYMYHRGPQFSNPGEGPMRTPN